MLMQRSIEFNFEAAFRQKHGHVLLVNRESVKVVRSLSNRTRRGQVAPLHHFFVHECDERIFGLWHVTNSDRVRLDELVVMTVNQRKHSKLDLNWFDGTVKAEIEMKSGRDSQ